MRKKLKVAVWLLFVLSLGLNLLAWGGLAVSPEFGTSVVPDLSGHAPIGALYAHAGRGVVRPLGLDALARARAEAWFGHSYPAIRANPEAGADILLREMGGVVTLVYYASVALLLVGLILQFTSPRPLRTFGAR